MPHCSGYNKRGGIYCVRAKQPLPLRGGESVLQPGSHSCYKALYFNVERATFVIAGGLLMLLQQQAINAHAKQNMHGRMVHRCLSHKLPARC